LEENGRGRCGQGEKVDEKGKKEYLGKRAIDFSTGKGGRVKEVRVGMRK
jgi:hypothetical protein